jgi:starch synthase
MIQILNISAECYPAAKTGGLADVVGSLPKYFSAKGTLSATILPKYSLKWMHQQEWTTIFEGTIRVDYWERDFSIQQESTNKLGYPLFVVDIPGLFDRPGIYNDISGASYGDEIERTLVFQQAVLKWVMAFEKDQRPRVLHCHDHHTALIPWMVKHCVDFRELANIPTVFTIHNGQYQGIFSKTHLNMFPFFHAWAANILEWNGAINPMACAIKEAWAVTTVSESYLYELHQSSLGLEGLLRQEWRKEWGILNGIDADVWNPSDDPMLAYRLNGDLQKFKAANKKILCDKFNLPFDQPLISFIGRIVGEKGADLLPFAYKNFMRSSSKGAFLVLGSGDKNVENEFRNMSYDYSGRFSAEIGYNETLSHQIYAGSDFLIMPSRVEPCGLNQLYSMRYGTIPIVRSVGGLKDTVPDVAAPNNEGRGIRFEEITPNEIQYALHRATEMYSNNPDIIHWLRSKIMAVDSSWENTIEAYKRVYRSVGVNF